MSAPAKAAAKFTAYWRLAGLNYLDQLTVASNALRKVMKEPYKSEALKSGQYKFREFVYQNGKELPGTEFSTMVKK